MERSSWQTSRFQRKVTVCCRTLLPTCMFTIENILGFTQIIRASCQLDVMHEPWWAYGNICVIPTTLTSSMNSPRPIGSSTHEPWWAHWKIHLLYLQHWQAPWKPSEAQWVIHTRASVGLLEYTFVISATLTSSMKALRGPVGHPHTSLGEPWWYKSTFTDVDNIVIKNLIKRLIKEFIAFELLPQSENALYSNYLQIIRAVDGS